MIRLLFALLYLIRVVHGSANTTSSTCPDLPEASYRSVWSILGSCALTLGICLWRTLHLNVPAPDDSEEVSMSTWHVLSVIRGFFAPEYIVGLATEQWIEARQIVAHFREKGYEWSMTHSHFAESGGFVHCDREGNLKPIKALEFLDLCEAGKIVNPLVTEDEIRDRSKSDAVSKAIFTIQLLWFLLQVSVRRSIGLVVTLPVVELDTGCMALLAVLYLLLWWNKPLGAGCPHIFYESTEAKIFSQEKLSEAWKPHRKSWWYAARKTQSTNDEENRKEATEASSTTSKPKTALNKAIQAMDDNSSAAQGIALLAAWCILGGLHLTAWNYEFPTEKEKIIWRAAALGLTVGPVVGVIGVIWDPIMYFGFVSALVCRVMLVVLMFLSLRALPCSAHQIVSWVQYIPHL